MPEDLNESTDALPPDGGRPTTPAATSNRLPVLAAEIRQAHADVQEAAKTAAQRAIDAGHALIEAKDLLPHGDGCHGCASTARSRSGRRSCT